MALALVGEKIDRNRFTGEKIENRALLQIVGGDKLIIPFC